jgi:hypothetical protein
MPGRPSTRSIELPVRLMTMVGSPGLGELRTADAKAGRPPPRRGLTTSWAYRPHRPIDASWLLHPETNSSVWRIEVESRGAASG